MIIGIGIDSIEIARFKDWKNYDKSSLEKTLNESEIKYCLEIEVKTAERFAARFAVKEAFFKAFKSAYPNINTPFLTICHNTCLKQEEDGRPFLNIDWDNILSANIDKITIGKNKIIKAKKIDYKKDEEIKKLKSHVSITHTNELATAIVILEKFLGH